MMSIHGYGRAKLCSWPSFCGTIIAATRCPHITSPLTFLQGAERAAHLPVGFADPAGLAEEVRPLPGVQPRLHRLPARGVKQSTSVNRSLQNLPLSDSRLTAHDWS